MERRRRLQVWCDTWFPSEAMDLLRRELVPHPLLEHPSPITSNLVPSRPSALAVEAEVVIGQPSLEALEEMRRVRWVHLTSAGWARYDTSLIRTWFAERGAQLTTSSSVYADPCAEQLLTAMLAFSRRLDVCLEDQTQRAWRAAEHRAHSRLLRGSRVVILGYGTIAKRLIALLRPFDVHCVVVRRHPRPEDPVCSLTRDEAHEAILRTEHLVNTLPGGVETEGYVDHAMLASLPPHAFFYNIGRGSTVDSDALLQALDERRLAGAYLDVTDPEPLPPSHPLWRAPRCVITPHMAGGQPHEHVTLIRHFLGNFHAFTQGRPLRDVALSA